mmetsp:Transcript_33008/g.70822  ORF Transcript_33008/g.70822 Transcript_33008/m.70822 type:complete len:556 (+) Transcript_33008:661-2328(+)
MDFPSGVEAGSFCAKSLVQRNGLGGLARDGCDDDLLLLNGHCGREQAGARRQAERGADGAGEAAFNLLVAAHQSSIGHHHQEPLFGAAKADDAAVEGETVEGVGDDASLLTLHQHYSGNAVRGDGHGHGATVRHLVDAHVTGLEEGRPLEVVQFGLLGVARSHEGGGQSGKLEDLGGFLGSSGGMDLVRQAAQRRDELQELSQSSVGAILALREASVRGVCGVGRVGRGLSLGLGLGVGVLRGLLLVVVVPGGGRREESIARGKRPRGAHVDHAGSEVAVLGVTDPRRLTRGLQEGLGTQDDLGTSGDDDEEPLQGSGEDGDPGQPPGQVVSASEAQLGALGRLSFGVGVGGGGGLLHCAAAVGDATTILSHVLHLVQKARANGGVELRGGRDEPEVLREGAGNLPGAGPPLPTRLLGHVLNDRVVGTGQIQHPQGHHKVGENSQQSEAPSDAHHVLSVVVVVLKGAGGHGKQRRGVAKELNLRQAMLAGVQHIEAEDERLGSHEDQGQRPHHPEAAQLGDGSADGVVGHGVEEGNDTIQHANARVDVVVAPLLL